MSAGASAVVRRATVEDAATVARMLHDFNTEYEEPSPGPEALARRLSSLLAGGDETIAVLIGEGPDGLAVMRLRPGLWDEGLEAYLAELYVVPPLRGRGIGRTLLRGAIELAREAGATYMDLTTTEDDVAARKLYERMGFSRTEGDPDGALSFYYELDL